MGRVSFADDVTERTIDEYDEEIEQQQQPVNIYPYENDKENKSWAGALPKKQGLYDPELEKDACGVGFAANIKGVPSHKIVTDGRSGILESRIATAKTSQRETCSAT